MKNIIKELTLVVNRIFHLSFPFVFPILFFMYIILTTILTVILLATTFFINKKKHPKCKRSKQGGNIIPKRISNVYVLQKQCC